MKSLLCLLLLFPGYQAPAQQAETIDLDQLQKIINADGDKILVINFWATWCAPCIRELPYFEKVATGGNDNIEVILVSMDLDLDPDPEKVHRFISRKNIQSNVVLLDEPNPDQWINRVDKSWSGALPATLVINQQTGKRKFVGKALHEGDLEKLIADVQ